MSNDSKDLSTANFCKEILSKGTFASQSMIMHINKSTFMLDFLEIGKRIYTAFRLICKSEDTLFLSYSKLTEYRKDVVLVNELIYVHNWHDATIGIVLSYQRILFQSLTPLFQILPHLTESELPLTIRIADGPDGSGCQQINNQYEHIPPQVRKISFYLLSKSSIYSNLEQ